MSEEKKDKLTVSQMADILGVSKTALRYYNKEGVTTFKRDKNNYRYYSEEQIDIFRTLKNFREMGFSIKTIKEIKKEMTLKEYEDLLKTLEAKTEKYKKEIEDIKSKQGTLDEYIKYIKVLTEIIDIEPDYIFKEDINLKKKQKMIFNIKKSGNKEYAVLYSGDNFLDLDAVTTLYKKIEEEGYEVIGDLSVEVVGPSEESNEIFSKIKIFKVGINC
ncbi:MerR family transcriptional regulator [Fusobacterium sp.]|uniref:MerR family transcriptional regulator n=1 Tax=Fusobacterium sp. TaxID=68766 RepID=UPI00262E21E5|nr:MerR family transcriptional regulator [Fusobacterium sp.]